MELLRKVKGLQDTYKILGELALYFDAMSRGQDSTIEGRQKTLEYDLLADKCRIGKENIGNIL